MLSSGLGYWLLLMSLGISLSIEKCSARLEGISLAGGSFQPFPIYSPRINDKGFVSSMSESAIEVLDSIERYASVTMRAGVNGGGKEISNCLRYDRQTKWP